MESIMSYAYDSSDEAEEDKDDETAVEDLSSLDKTLSQKLISDLCVEDDSVKPEIADKGLIKFNFLGLEVAGKVSSFGSYKSQAQEKMTRKVHTSCGEVEVPSGEFWRDFTPETTTLAATAQGDNNSGLHKIQTVRSDIPGDSLPASFPLSQHEAPTKRWHSSNTKLGKDEFYGSYGKQIRLSNQALDFNSPVYSSFTDDFRNADSLYTSSNRLKQHTNPVASADHTEVNGIMASEKRKLFYIHSIIAPYVNTKPVNKCADKCVNSWHAHDGVVNRLAWNISSFSHLLVTAGMDAAVRVWSVWSNLDSCVASLSCHKKAVKHVEWCQTGRKVLSCSYDRTAQVSDIETAKTVGQFEHMSYVTAGHVLPSNPNLFITGTESTILKWDMRTSAAPVRYFSYKDKFGQVQDLLFINDGHEFVSCSDLVSRDSADRSIMVWDLRTGSVLSNQIFQERYVCTRLKLHPSNSAFMAQTHAGYVALFSTASPYKMDKSKRYEGHKTDGYSIGFDISPDGGLVYSGSSDASIHCYHQHTGRLIKRLHSERDIITDVACHPVLPSLLASSTWAGQVSLWK